MAGCDLRVSKSPDGSVIWLWRNGSTWTFSPEGWFELISLMREFTDSGVLRLQNFAEPIRERVAAPPQTGKLASLNLADLGL